MNKLKAKHRRGIALLPNLLTTGALTLGFYAIISAMNGRFELAIGAVIGAMVLDGLDGRVARMANVQSDFGAEYDSLADMVSFGVAPALVMYEWALSGLGKVGGLAAFVYTVCAALRLARFNTQVGKADKRFFQGLPSPAAAGVVIGFVWVMGDYGLQGKDYAVWAFALTMVAGLLMVASPVRYYSFKEIDGRVRFFVTVVIAMIFGIFLFVQPPLVLFSLICIFALSGPIFTLFMMRRARRRGQLIPPSTDKPSE